MPSIAINHTWGYIAIEYSPLGMGASDCYWIIPGTWLWD